MTKGYFFSCHQYMKVTKIDDTTITLEDDKGKELLIDKECLVSDSYSADHYDKEVTCNMTELSEILEGANDTIFKVEFHKKVDDKQIFEKLESVKAADIKDETKLKNLAKSLIEGKDTTMIAHLVQSDQHMGRSLVLDLEAPATNRWRQVDHRTIQSIILRNVKYTLGKKSTLSSQEEPKFNLRPKWDAKKLKVGNWFSECQYYQLENGGPKDEMMDVYINNESKDNYQVPKDQLIDMYSGTLYESEEKVTRTEMVETLLNAKECVFTVTFRKKVQAKDIEDILSSIKTDA